MKNWLSFVFALIISSVSFSQELQPLEKARAAVVSGDLQAAILTYAEAAKSQKAEVVAEYGWVLAKAGHVDLSLAQLDRALQLDRANAEVLYYTSSVLKSIGLTEAAAEISRPAPAWLTNNENLPQDHVRGPLLATYLDDINAAIGLLMQRRYASAADRYYRMTKKYPRERHAWGGYAIAAESLGAYKTAAKAVAKDIELSPNADEKTRALQTAHKTELEARPPLETPAQKAKANEMLKGRFLVFFGGSVSNMSDETIMNINGRAGKFLTDNFDAGANVGFVSGYSNSDYNGISLGLSARYLTPLPVAAPLSFVMGTRLQYSPGPSDQTTFYLSPGLSYFLPNGSIDLTVDLGLAGPLKDTRTLSLGYTVYLGGTK